MATKAELQKQVAELSELAAAQELMLDDLRKEISKQIATIKHLEDILQKTVPVLDVKTAPLQPEEEIALMQLELLKRKAASGELSLEETKKYDILVKNKRLAQGESTTINAEYEKIKSLKPRELMTLATNQLTLEKKKNIIPENE